MIWIDYTILGLIFISSVIGLLRGFIKEVFSLVIWVVASWVGLTFSRVFSGFLEGVITQPSLRIVISFAVLFLITLILGALISYLLSELIKSTGLTGTDRFAGMIFGVFRGFVVISIAITLAGLTPLPEDSWWKESSLIPPFQSLAVWLREHIPSGLMDNVNF